MRKVIVSDYVTLDGFFAGPQGERDWFVWDEEMANDSKDLLMLIDTILFGRVTNALMADYWTTARPPAEDPDIRSGSILSALAQQDLIDDYLLFADPVVLEDGKPLFNGIMNRLDLKLLEARTFSCGSFSSAVSRFPGYELRRGETTWQLQ